MIKIWAFIKAGTIAGGPCCGPRHQTKSTEALPGNGGRAEGVGEEKKRRRDVDRHNSLSVPQAVVDPISRSRVSLEPLAGRPPDHGAGFSHATARLRVPVASS